MNTQVYSSVVVVQITPGIVCSRGKDGGFAFLALVCFQDLKMLLNVFVGVAKLGTVGKLGL